MPRLFDPQLLDLNPGFLLEREIAPVSVMDGQLSLAMRNPSDAETIAAVRFATGLEIVPTALDEDEWSVWHEALSASSKADVAQAVTIALDEHSVSVSIVPDYQGNFAADDRQAWLRLATFAKQTETIRVLLLRDVVWSVDLPCIPHDEAELRRELADRSPIQIDRAAWSSMETADGDRPACVGIVRKAWLEQRIGAIMRALSPASLTIRDEAGRTFALYPTPTKPSYIPVAVASLTIAVCAAALALWWGGMSNVGIAPAITTKPVTVRPVNPAPTSPSVALSDNATIVPFALIGVVGRLPNDAVALVRPGWGRTLTLRVGDSLLGWRVAAIGADRVLVTKGAITRTIGVKPPPAG